MSSDYEKRLASAGADRLLRDFASRHGIKISVPLDDDIEELTPWGNELLWGDDQADGVQADLEVIP
jgi:hypothetical protein